MLPYTGTKKYIGVYTPVIPVYNIIVYYYNFDIKFIK